MKFHPRMVVIIFGILILYTGINFYLGLNLMWWLDSLDIGYSSLWLWMILSVFAYGYIIGRIPLSKYIAPVARLLKVLGSCWIYVIEIGLILALIVDLGGVVVRLVGGELLTYTQFFGTIAIVSLVLSMVVGMKNAYSPIVRKYSIKIDKKGRQFHKLNVVVASDIHLGNLVGNRHIRRLVKQVDVLKPDLVLLPGDVIDDSIEPFLRKEMSKELAKLKAKHGVYAILGNHEYYGGHIEQYVQKMKEIGIRVLQDEVVELHDSLYIVGRKDKTAESTGPEGRVAVGELTADLMKDKPIILLDHQPTMFQQAADAGVDLMLSGHTHRGQYVPNHLFTKRLFELDWGYMRKHAMHVIVSSGFGFWGPPVRLGSRSEIIHVTIEFDL
ncbi:MAG: metallophosphoesterase [Candidatus Cohnella colombiensis]|uniref:Metallophosphoesterase n=1 Tax=Candidatus Cohnella colombiensis TaxID=3121368 RepID=A0AA95JGY8_9BACL|nr:MAG: metallophosphoesterase [Cohnella sp.]